MTAQEEMQRLSADPSALARRLARYWPASWDDRRKAAFVVALDLQVALRGHAMGLDQLAGDAARAIARATDADLDEMAGEE